MGKTHRKRRHAKGFGAFVRATTERPHPVVATYRERQYDVATDTWRDIDACVACSFEVAR